MIEVTNNIVIGEDQLRFVFSRSSGPGGQNVNKVNSRVTVFFDVANCPNLSEGQKKRIAAKLKSRMSKDGVLHVHCQKYRTQGENRVLVIERIAGLLRSALVRKPPRKKTRMPRAAKMKRLEEKKRRGDIKRLRGKKVTDDR